MELTRRLTTALALCLLAACTPSPASPAATVNAERSTIAARPEPAERKPSDAPVGDVLARALDLAVDPTTLSALQASPHGSAVLLEPRTHEVWSHGESTAEFARRLVLDDGRNGHPRRLTLLCDGYQARVEVEIDAQGLRPVTIKSTFVSPEGGSGSGDPVVPGVRLGAGEVLEFTGKPAGGKRPVLYASSQLTVSGLVPEQDVDIVNASREALPAIDARGARGTLRRSVDLLDAPNGSKFGRVEVFERGSAPAGEEVRVVARRSDHALILLDLGAAQAIGWVPETAFQPGFTSESDDVWGGLSSESDKTVRLSQGTVLLGPRSDQPVGVVKRDGEFRCFENCRGLQPMVIVDDACGTELNVRARAPG